MSNTKIVCPCCRHEQEHDVVLASLPPACRCEKCHEVSPCAAWHTLEYEERATKSFEQLHAEAMEMLRNEWARNNVGAVGEIRSTQISALVGVLVRKGILP